MITVHTEELLKIQQGSVSIEALKLLVQGKQDADFHIGIFKGNKIIQIFSTKELLNDQPTLMTSLVHGEHVFDEARKLFTGILGGGKTLYSEIAVTDELGNYLYFLKNEPNQVHHYDYVSDFENYDITDSRMDFELIERGNVFIFNTFEEYTYAIARILQMNFSEKYVFFLDPKAALFFEDNERLSVLPNMQSFYLEYKHLLNKSIFLIDSQRKCKYNFDNWISKKYCSLELMTSLFWCCDVVSFGEKNPDKIFYLIKNPLGGGGLADLIKFTLFRVEMVCQKNVSYIPVVDLSLKDDDNQFTHGNGDNAWTYFFEPVSEYSLEEVYQSKNVIISKDRLEFFNPYLNEQRTCANWREMFRKYLKFNKASEEYVQNMFSQIYPSEQERVLGVIGRGTDYNNPKARMVPRPMDPAIFLANVEQQFVRGKYDKIFLATEDAQVFDLFMQSSLKDYIFYIEQERFDYSDPTNKELYLADIKRRAEHDGYTDNLRYLSVLYTLSKCNGLMSTCICGAANVALALNDGMYEEVKIF